MNYELNEAQKRRWQSLVKPKWGFQAGLSENEELGGGTAGSRKTSLNHFFKGHPDGLRWVFGEENRCRIVAEAMGLAGTDELRELLRRALAGDSSDRWEDARVPGFEDYGPVPVDDIFVEPDRNGSYEADNSLALLPQFVKKLVDRGERAVVIVVEGPPGSGRTIVLRAFHAELSRLGVKVARQGNTTDRTPDVWLADDFDLLDQDDQAALLEDVSERRAGLIASVLPGGEAALGRDRVVLWQLVGQHRAWVDPVLGHRRTPVPLRRAQAALARVREVVERRFKRDVDTAEVGFWLERNPLLAALVTTPRAVGLLARRQSKHPAPSPKLSDVLESALEVCSMRCEGEDSPHAATFARFVQEQGKSLMERAAKSSYESGEAPSRSAIVELVRDLTDGSAPNPAEPGSLWTSALAERLTRYGLFYDRGGKFYPTDPLFYMSTIDPGTWRQYPVALRHQLLMVEAVEKKSVDDALGRLLGLDSPELAESMPSLLALLTCDLKASDTSRLRLAFDLALVWWCEFVAPPGVVRPGETPRQSEVPLQGHGPVCLLGEVSIQRRAELSSVTSVPLRDADELRAIASIHGRRRVAPDIAHLRHRAATVGLEPTWSMPDWVLLNEREAEVFENSSGWRWRQVVGRDWIDRGELDGLRVMVGVGDSAAWPPLDLHLKPLIAPALKVLAHKDHREGEAAFLRLFERAIRESDSSLAAQLLTVWGDLDRRGRLRERLGTRVAALGPSFWTTGKDRLVAVAEALLRDVIGDEDVLADVWTQWLASHQRALPWALFTACGLPDTKVLDWLEAAPPSAEDVHETMLRRAELRGARRRDPKAGRPPNATSPESALDELLCSDKPELLARLARGPFDVWTRQDALRRLSELKPSHAAELLRQSLPDHSARTLASSFADLRWRGVDVIAATTDDDWVRARDASQHVPSRMTFALLAAAKAPTAQRLAEARQGVENAVASYPGEDDHRHWDDWNAYSGLIGRALRDLHAANPTAAADFAQLLLDSELFDRMLADQILAVMVDCLSRDALMPWLRGRLTRSVHPAATLQRCLNAKHSLALFESLCGDPETAALAADTVNARILPERTDWFTALLTVTSRGESLEVATLTLIRGLAERNAGAALSWVADSGGDADTLCSRYAAVAQSAPPGEARLNATRRALAVT